MPYWRGVDDMARSIAYALVSFPLWLAMSGTAAGQTAVEAGLGAARAATTAAPAKGIGKAMSGLAGSLEKTVQARRQSSDGLPAGAATARTAAGTLSPSAKDAPPDAPDWEDPSGIQTGIGYPELVRRFGPALEITDELGKSLTYSGKAGVFQVEVRDGKVTSIVRPKS